MLLQLQEKYPNTENDKLLSLLLEQAKEDKQLTEGMLKEEKTLEQLKSYVNQTAREELKSSSGYVESAKVVGWGIHYFVETNEDLGLIKKEVAEVKVEKPKAVEKKPEKVTNKSGVSFELIELDLFGD